MGDSIESNAYTVLALIKDIAYGSFFFLTTIFELILCGYLYSKVKNFITKKLQGVDTSRGILADKQVIITGGSSGIGKAFAIVAAKNGANVTIIARNKTKLDEALEEISAASLRKDEQQIKSLSLDIGNSSYEKIEKELKDLGACYMLVNCAGVAVGGKIEDTSEDTFERMINLNLKGTYNCTKAVVSGMKQRKEGKIVIVGSQASLLGIYGLSGYCATKSALRGLAESLSMELTPYNVSVTLSLPPDTDTPGFEIEQQTKPRETTLICESAGLMKAERVAEQLMKDVMNCKFTSIVGFESFILTTLSSGMSPYASWYELLLQATLMGPLRVVSAFYLNSFEKIVKDCMNERESQKKAE